MQCSFPLRSSEARSCNGGRPMVDILCKCMRRCAQMPIRAHSGFMAMDLRYRAHSSFPPPTTTKRFVRLNFLTGSTCRLSPGVCQGHAEGYLCSSVPKHLVAPLSIGMARRRLSMCQERMQALRRLVNWYRSTWILKSPQRVKMPK